MRTFPRERDHVTNSINSVRYASELNIEKSQRGWKKNKVPHQQFPPEPLREGKWSSSVLARTLASADTSAFSLCLAALILCLAISPLYSIHVFLTFAHPPCPFCCISSDLLPQETGIWTIDLLNSPWLVLFIPRNAYLFLQLAVLYPFVPSWIKFHSLSPDVFGSACPTSAFYITSSSKIALLVKTWPHSPFCHSIFHSQAKF